MHSLWEDGVATMDQGQINHVERDEVLPIASTSSARVAGPEGITRLDAIECWIYQHGLRHMGDVEHARALVGLQGMTS
ncbi:MAG TPA: hypothetical protein VFV02_02710 [Acidimicrobiales bacterium]|nr:hypothetical protein [Acidimicrobiales bacterium]